MQILDCCGYHWFDWLEKSLVASVTLGWFFVGSVAAVIFFLATLIISPIGMWLPTPELKHPTLVEKLADALAEGDKDAGH